MNDGTLITGDWKNIIIYKNNNNEYKQINQIAIGNKITSLLTINENIFVAACYDLRMIKFYDLKNNNNGRSLNNIKCTDDAQNCICVIDININETEQDNILIIGGAQCLYFVSTKYQTLINRLFLPEVTYFKVIKKWFESSIICSGLFNQYSIDLICYKVVYQRGYNKFNLIEGFRIRQADHGPINSILCVKSRGGNEDGTQNSEFIITGGMEKTIKVYS